MSNTSLNAQPWYGQVSYPHDSTTLSSAKRTLNNQGYVMAGFRPVRQTGSASPDFVIDKVDGNGGFSTPVDFSVEYQILNDPLCSSSPVFVNNCSGISIIETNNLGNGEAYAIAGTFSTGVFFATLDAFGTPINVWSWNFPGVNGNLHKPSLRESANSGDYYICGVYQFDGFVIKVNGVSGALWSNIYSTPQFEPRDLIESPYHANELIVVGRVDVTGGSPTAADAFFMRLNSLNGTHVQSDYYNFLSWDADDWFSSIELATGSTTSPGGYILGGWSNGPDGPPCGLPPCTTKNNNSYPQWMSRMDQNGNLVWSTLIQPAARDYTIITGAEIAKVYERYNANTNRYEYYGVGGSYFMPGATGVPYGSANLVVFRLDENGTTGALSPTEFHYPMAWAPFGVSKGLCDLAGISGSANNDGIQVFGTGSVAQEHMFIKGYYNGASGCRDTLVDIDSIAVGPQLVGIFTPTISALQVCNGVMLNTNIVATSVNTYCWALNVASGSNAKSTTGINRVLAPEADEVVFPNPVKDELFLKLPNFNDSGITITIINSLGQKVHSSVYDRGSDETLRLEMSAFNLSKGLYTVIASDSAKNQTFKFIKD